MFIYSHFSPLKADTGSRCSLNSDKITFRIGTETRVNFIEEFEALFCTNMTLKVCSLYLRSICKTKSELREGRVSRLNFRSLVHLGHGEDNNLSVSRYIFSKLFVLRS